jgi:hypothetical protein
MEPRKGSRPAGDYDQALQGGRDMDEEMGLPLLTAEKSIRSQGLHQTLGGCQMEKRLEFVPLLHRSGKVVIGSEESGALLVPELHVRIIEKRSEIVEEAPRSHPLKIDQNRVPFPDHHVLGL